MHVIIPTCKDSEKSGMATMELERRIVEVEVEVA
jgi:hypothetical protein